MNVMLTTFEIIDANPDIPIERKEVDFPNDPGYDQLSSIISPILEGAFMEHVFVIHNGEYTDMFVDEQGALKELPINKRASEIYNENMRIHTGYVGCGCIFGKAVLFDRRVWF